MEQDEEIYALMAQAKSQQETAQNILETLRSENESLKRGMAQALSSYEAKFREAGRTTARAIALRLAMWLTGIGFTFIVVVTFFWVWLLSDLGDLRREANLLRDKGAGYIELCDGKPCAQVDPKKSYTRTRDRATLYILKKK